MTAESEPIKPVWIALSVLAMIAAMLVGVGYEHFRPPTKPDDATRVISNTLRQIASAADQHFIESGATIATYTDLVGTDRYILNLVPYHGATYRHLFPIESGFTELSVVRSDNVVVVHTVSAGAKAAREYRAKAAQE